MDGVCWQFTVRKIFPLWKAHLKHHLSLEFIYCWGEKCWLAWIHVHPCSKVLAAPQQPERTWHDPKQESKAHTYVVVDREVQYSVGFPVSKLEGARAQAGVLSSDCPCYWIVRRRSGWRILKQCSLDRLGASTSQDLFSTGSMDKAAHRQTETANGQLALGLI